MLFPQQVCRMMHIWLRVHTDELAPNPDLKEKEETREYGDALLQEAAQIPFTGERAYELMNLIDQAHPNGLMGWVREMNVPVGVIGGDDLDAIDQGRKNRGHESLPLHFAPSE